MSPTPDRRGRPVQAGRLGEGRLGRRLGRRPDTRAREGWLLLGWLLGAWLLLAGCDPVLYIEEESPSPTTPLVTSPTPSPTGTPEPVPSVTPTSEPETPAPPTATPTASPSPTPTAPVTPVPTACSDFDGDGTCDALDCAPDDAQVSPQAPERCNQTDDDCDGTVDEGVQQTFYGDQDLDGYGASGTQTLACTLPEGYSDVAGDCNDGLASIFPGAAEACNGLDDDCDGTLDNGLPTVFFFSDNDLDGYGDASQSISACAAPVGYVSLTGDCNDDDAQIGPAATEVPANGVDEDCDGHASRLIQVAAGFNHTLGLDDDGHVWAWGHNQRGQLGDGTSTSRLLPVMITGLQAATIVAIAGGESHSYALDETGGVWAWGDNGSGQLGTGSTSSSTVPQMVSLPAELTVVAIASGQDFGMALGRLGDVWTWGANTSGQLGDGSTTTRTTPVNVAQLGPASGAPVVGIAAGASHSLALLTDGTVRAWGRNDSGQLGDQTNTSRTLPVNVLGLTGVRSVACGSQHSLAVKTDGTVFAWGRNADAQLGTGTTTSSTAPLKVIGLSAIASVTGGATCSLALQDNGTVYAWGDNGYGQLGNGNTLSQSTPVRVDHAPIGLQVQAGQYHLVLLTEEGQVWTWGYNLSGQLGNGTTNRKSTPLEVALPTPQRQVMAGGYHSLTQGEDLGLWAWGLNNQGALGDGSDLSRSAPVSVLWPDAVRALAGGRYHSVALDETGQVWTWGLNKDGQLGDGSTLDQWEATPVSGLPEGVAVAAGLNHTLMLSADGGVYAWGGNAYGQLGDGTTTSHSAPVLVIGLPKARAIAAGDYFSLALLTDGTIRAWGRNNWGQLGNGTTTNQTTPVVVTGLSGVTAVSAGSTSAASLLEDGTVWTWGSNVAGQLGTGDGSSKSLVPVGVPGFSRGVQLVAGYLHVLALDETGKLWGWGDNAYAQLGDGTFTDRKVPVGVAGGLLDPVQLAAGVRHSVVLLNDGSVWTWGQDSQGQLGQGADTWSPASVVWTGSTGTRGQATVRRSGGLP